MHETTSARPLPPTSAPDLFPAAGTTHQKGGNTMHPGNTPNTSSRRRNPLHRLLALLLRHQARSARRYNAAHHRPPFDRPAVTTRAPALWDPELYSGDSKWAATYHDPKGDKP